jgi:hypothetical protein
MIDHTAHDNADKGMAEAEDQTEEQQETEVHRSKRNNRGTNKKYADYFLMMNAWKQARCWKRAFIKDEFTFFSAKDLSNAKHVHEEDRDKWALGVSLVHYSMHAGLKKFKEKGKAGVSKELKQMHNMEVSRPVEEGSLLKKEKAKAVALLMFLKEKRDHSVKARMCADVRKQRDDWMKQDTTSPTVSTEGVFIMAAIKAHK